MDFVSHSFDFKRGDRCVVIGEIGVNHNCDEDILMQMIDKGAEAGLDIIKLQRFNAALEISERGSSQSIRSKQAWRKARLKWLKN